MQRHEETKLPLTLSFHPIQIQSLLPCASLSHLYLCLSRKNRRHRRRRKNRALLVHFRSLSTAGAPPPVCLRLRGPACRGDWPAVATRRAARGLLEICSLQIRTGCRDAKCAQALLLLPLIAKLPAVSPLMRCLRTPVRQYSIQISEKLHAL